MLLFVRVLIHILPVLILLTGRFYLATAAALFTLVCYIKVNKLSQQALETTEPDEKTGLLKARKFWLALTFLDSE